MLHLLSVLRRFPALDGSRPAPQEMISPYFIVKLSKCLQGQWVSTIIVSLSYFSSGVGMAWTSPVFKLVEDGEPGPDLTHLQMSIVAAVPFAGRLLSPIPASYLMDILGRRLALLLARLVQVAHWVLLIASYRLPALLAARFMTGCFSGVCMVVVGVYLSETTQRVVRGRTQAVVYATFSFGTVVVTASGPHLSYDQLNAACGLIDLTTSFLLLLIPESPYFLLKKEEYDEAQRSFEWLRHAEEVTEEMQRVDRYMRLQMGQRRTYGYIFRDRPCRRALILVVLLLVFQRLTGMTAIVSHASILMPDTPWLPERQSPLLLNVVYLLATVAASFVVDSWGRKRFLLLSSSGLSLTLAGLAVWFYLSERHGELTAGTEWLPVALLLSQAVFYSLGYCFIPPLLMTELFPMNVKAKANALGSMVAVWVSMVVVFLFLPIAKHLGTYVNFIIYSGAALCGALYSLTIVETRGKSLEAIQASLRGLATPESSRLRQP